MLLAIMTHNINVCPNVSDAFFKSKAIISAVVVMYYSFVGTRFYFQGNDVSWNLFESYSIQESNIGFKSVCLSSLAWLRQLIKVYVCMHSNDSDKNDMNTIYS